MASTTVEDRANFDEKLKVEARASMEHLSDKEAAWEAERKKSKPDLNVKFVYAYVLSRSSMERHKVTGIRLLNELITAKFNLEESLYACAVAHYALGQYTEARDMVDRLLRSNPDHRYANELHAFIKDAQAKQDLVVGVGVGLGIATAAAAVIVGALAAGRRRR